MSASERLRALDVPLAPATWEVDDWDWEGWPEGSPEATCALRNALPLIRDVVEAAERVSEQIGAMGSTEKGEGALVAAGIESNQLAWHLAALREHLRSRERRA